MTPDQMAEEALKGPQNAARVIQYLEAAKGWAGAGKVWEQLVFQPSVMSNPLAGKAFIKYLTSIAPSPDEAMRLFYFLSSSIEYRESLIHDLVALLHYAPDSDYVPVMLLAADTPGSVIMHIISNWGMTPKAIGKDVAKREALLKRFVQLVKEGYEWRNEVSGAIFGSLLKANPKDNLAKVLVTESEVFPQSFSAAVFEHGTPDMQGEIVVRVAKTSTDINAIFTYLKSATEIDVARIVIDSMYDNPVIPPEDKAEFFKKCYMVYEAGQSSIFNSTTPYTLKEHLCKSDQKPLFETAIEFLEAHKLYDVNALTSNITMAMGYYDRIWGAVKDLNLENEVTEGFRGFVSFFGEDEEDDFGNLYNNSWYDRYVKS